MGKIRIYELARELGVENKLIIGKAQELGMSDKNSHSNSLDADQADHIRRAVIRLALGSSPEQVTTTTDASGARVTVRRKGNIIRRRRQDDQESDQASQETSAAAELPDQENGVDQVSASEPTLDSIFKETKPQVPDPSAGEVPAGDESTSQELQTEEFEPSLDNTGSADLAQSQSDLSAEHDSVDSAAVADSSTVAKPEPEAKDVGPRVLGKIELPQKEAKTTENKSSSERKSAGQKAGKGKSADYRSDSDDSARRDGKRRSPKERKSRKREFSIGELVDYEGRVGKRPKKKKATKGGKDVVAEDDQVLQTEITKPKASKRIVKIDEAISVGDLARAMSLKSGEVITKLIELGVMATINQMVDIDTATIVAEEFDFQVESISFDETEMLDISEDQSPDSTESRAPVVTVMGHVDHGKTSLLDSIRKTSVAEKEHGGITQHIGAYRVQLSSGQTLSFIDTPGHEAFTAMRARGANVTDIVILVVAADDGVMPQTIEAVNHAKAAKVPTVVAVNKMDKAGANPDKIKQQMAEIGLQPEDWGGDTMYYPISALNGEGIDQLLEGVLLQAEVLELKANPNMRAKGTIIESRQDRRRGLVATVLVQQGTLKVGDPFMAGAEYGRVRSMTDHLGQNVDKAGPSDPVEITGFNGTPEAGDDFHVLDSDSQARELATRRLEKKQKKDQLLVAGGPISLEEFARKAATEEAAELNVILKADVQGSVEAVKQSLEKLSGNKVVVKIVHSSVGGITESDVKLAIASKALIVGFGVRAEPRAARDAESSAVELRFYNVIYELVEDIKKAMVGLLEPIKKEKSLGRVEVRDTFVIPKQGTIAGCYVVDGTIKRGSSVRLVRDSRVVFEGKMGSLRRFKDDVKEVQSGYECGIGIERYNDIKIGDVMEVFDFEEIEATLD